MSLSSEKTDIDAILGRLFDNMSACIAPNIGIIDGAELRHKLGEMRSFYFDFIEDGTFATRLSDWFDLAVKLRVTLPSLTNIHQVLLTEEPVEIIATSLTLLALVLCLAAESKLISDITFTSSDAANDMITKMFSVFEAAQEMASDRSDDPSILRSLLTLGGSLINHLATTARPLPRMIDFNLSVNLPAPALSNRVYFTPDRWEEIVTQNKIVHPAFCPRSFRGLSS